jgi:predicted Zn-dependent protease
MVKFLTLDPRPALSMTLALIAAAVGACSINPVSNLPEVTLLTVEQEKKLGGEEAKKVEQEMGLLDDAALNSYADALGQRLVKESPRQDIPYQFHVVDMVEPNAFALPGASVYFTRGLPAAGKTAVGSSAAVANAVGNVPAAHASESITLH